jgi:hypothetical protein
VGEGPESRTSNVERGQSQSKSSVSQKSKAPFSDSPWSVKSYVNQRGGGEGEGGAAGARGAVLLLYLTSGNWEKTQRRCSLWPSAA